MGQDKNLCSHSRSFERCTHIAVGYHNSSHHSYFHLTDLSTKDLVLSKLSLVQQQQPSPTPLLLSMLFLFRNTYSFCLYLSVFLLQASLRIYLNYLILVHLLGRYHLYQSHRSWEIWRVCQSQSSGMEDLQGLVPQLEHLIWSLVSKRIYLPPNQLSLLLLMLLYQLREQLFNHSQLHYRRHLRCPYRPCSGIMVSYRFRHRLAGSVRSCHCCILKHSRTDSSISIKNELLSKDPITLRGLKLYLTISGPSFHLWA